MPLHNRRDSQGSYFIWGEHGHKYYYKNERSKTIAKEKAMRQARAIAWRRNVQGSGTQQAREKNKKNKNATDWVRYFQKRL